MGEVADVSERPQCPDVVLAGEHEVDRRVERLEEMVLRDPDVVSDKRV